MFRKVLILLVLGALTLAACVPASGSPATPAGSDESVTGSTPTTSDESQPVIPPTSDTGLSGDENGRSPLVPLENEAKMVRGNAFVESSSISILESYPVQIMLHLEGNLPTPCNKLRANMSEPDAENHINIEVFSVANPDEICIQVIQPFNSNINLGSFKPGTYQVFVNGQKVGEFTS